MTTNVQQAQEKTQPAKERTWSTTSSASYSERTTPSCPSVAPPRSCQNHKGCQCHALFLRAMKVMSAWWLAQHTFWLHQAESVAGDKRFDKPPFTKKPILFSIALSTTCASLTNSIPDLFAYNLYNPYNLQCIDNYMPFSSHWRSRRTKRLPKTCLVLKDDEHNVLLMVCSA